MNTSQMSPEVILVLQDLLDTMNEALSLDRSAISTLVAQRVVCNEAFMAHPTIAVTAVWVVLPDQPEPAEKTECFFVGLLGILNGILGKVGSRYGHPFTLYANYEDEEPDVISHFTLDCGPMGMLFSGEDTRPADGQQ